MGEVFSENFGTPFRFSCDDCKRVKINFINESNEHFNPIERNAYTHISGFYSEWKKHNLVFRSNNFLSKLNPTCAYVWVSLSPRWNRARREEGKSLCSNNHTEKKTLHVDFCTHAIIVCSSKEKKFVQMHNSPLPTSTIILLWSWKCMLQINLGRPASCPRTTCRTSHMHKIPVIQPLFSPFSMFLQFAEVLLALWFFAASWQTTI